MRLHHVGIVVDNLGSHGAAYSNFLGLTAHSEIFHDPTQKVKIQFWKDSVGNLLELIEPTEPNSPVASALKKGGGLNHICFEVDNLESEIQRAVESGALVASGIAPAIAFSGRRVVFLFFPKLQLVELVEAGPE